ncbi:MAG: heterocyst frequency control protein PatD [Actinomycetota bacterium]
MVSLDRQQDYRQFQQALKKLQSTVRPGNLDRRALLAELRDVQQCFGNQILRPDSEERAPESPREQSYLTEIHRLLRLLGMDVTFLQASRQSATAEARQAAISDRINTLIRYCGALLEQDEE